MGQLSDGPMDSMPPGHAPKVMVQQVSFHKSQVTTTEGVIPSLLMVFHTVDGEQHPFVFDVQMLVPMFEGALVEAGVIEVTEGEIVDD